MSRILTMCGVVVMILLFIAAKGSKMETGTVKDIDGNIYKTVKIGNQWWMAENLRVTRDPKGNSIKSFCYNNEKDYCRKYGRLYSWDVAMNGAAENNARGIAPEGWHIPSEADWNELLKTPGGPESIAERIRVGGKTGFDAYLSGGADFKGNYLYLDAYAMFWSSTETGEMRAYHMGISKNNKWDKFAAMKGAKIHVRCVKNKD